MSTSASDKPPPSKKSRPERANSSHSKVPIIEKIGSAFAGDQKWIGGHLANDGCIYAIPFIARFILKIIPETGESFLVGEDLGDAVSWAGSVLGPDNCLYGIPFDGNRILKFDPLDESLSLVGEDLGNVENKYGAGILADNGLIYFMPFNANKILCLNPADGSTRHVGDDFGLRG